jgi:exonuclease SbcC
VEVLCGEEKALIEEVRMENFVSHRESTINLNEGVSVFVGHNGAGKSSVIDAVTFALYGEHMRGDNRNLVRRGASESAVSVTFSVRGKKYLAQRRVDAKGKLQAAVLKEITEHGVRQIVAGERRQMEESMAEEVRKITGLSFDMMKIATIVQQGELDKIVTEYKPSEVKNLINEVIGIEKLDKAYQSMREVLNDFKRRLREAYYNYDTDSIDALVQQVGKDKKEREEETSALQAILSELQKLQEEEKAVTERIRTLEELKAKADKANTLRQNLNNRVEELRDDLKREIKELEAKIPKARSSLLLVKEKEEVESALAKLVQREQELGTIIGELMGKMGELKGIDVKRMESEIQKLEGKLKEKSTRIDELLSKIKQLEGVKKPGERSELEAKQSELEEARDEARGKLGQIREKINDYERLKQTGVCPVCDTEVTPENVEAKLAVKKKEEEEKSNEIKNIENELKNVKQLLEDLRDYEQAQKELADLKNELEEASKEKEEIDNELTEKRGELERQKKKLAELPALEQRLKEAQEERSKIQADKKELDKKNREIIAAEEFLTNNNISSEDDVAKLEKRKSELEVQLKMIPEQIEKADVPSLKIDGYTTSLANQITELLEEAKGYDETEYTKLKNRYEKEIRPDLARLSSEKGGKEASIKRLGEEINKLGNAKEELEEASKYIAIFEKIRNEVYNRDGALATSLRSWAIKQISARASQYVRAFGIGISQIEFREDKRAVNILCYGDRGEVSIASMSGGEKVAVALALRFAIADLIGKGNVDFIVFDEPTTHLDEERRRSLIKLISGFGNEQNYTSLSQIIVITHDEEIFEDSEVGMIYKFENSPEGTRISLAGSDAGD